MKKILVFSAFMFFNYLSFCAFAEEPKLEFFAENCHGFSMEDSSPSGIKEFRWLENGILEVECFVYSFCGGIVFSGDYVLKGDSLTLRYSNEINGPLTRCTCKHKLLYRFLGLAEKDYKISFIAKGENK